MTKEISFNELKDILNGIQKVGEDLTVQIANSIEKKARRNFKRAQQDTGSDIERTIVSVRSSVSLGSTECSATITCSGDQVLYMEFGAGVYNDSYWVEEYETARYVWENDGMYSVRFGKGGGYDKGRIGFKFVNNTITEVMPRPAGIGKLGHDPTAKHNPSWGNNGLWVRLGTAPNVTAGESIVHKKNGDPRPANGSGQVPIWTTGTLPSRSLYRATINTLRAIERQVNGK